MSPSARPSAARPSVSRRVLDALFALGDGDERNCVSPASIARSLRVGTTRLQTLLDRLDAAGLIARTSDGNVRITAAGILARETEVSSSHHRGR